MQRNDVVVAGVALAACAAAFALTFRFTATTPAAILGGMGAEFFPRLVLAVITLFYAVGYWSAWFNASIYLNEQEMMPLQNVMIQLVQKQEAPVGLSQAIKTGQLSGLAIQMAVMVMALLPVAVLSPFVQKHFKKGMLTGAVKG